MDAPLRIGSAAKSPLRPAWVGGDSAAVDGEMGRVRDGRGLPRSPAPLPPLPSPDEAQPGVRVGLDDLGQLAGGVRV